MKNPQRSPAAALDAQGCLLAGLSYGLWGFFPLYWKLLHGRPALEILAHRLAWSFVFYVLIFIFFSRRPLRSMLQQTKRDWLISAAAAFFLSINWGVYIYAVNSGRIMEGSLAYFINPILNVIVGVLFFSEPFPPVLRISVACAALGVASKVFGSASFPAIPLILAGSFCAYGAAKKMLRASPTHTSVMEGLMGLAPAVAGILYFQSHAKAATPGKVWALFIGAGVVTGLPLFLFSYAARRIPYSVMGMLQFIAPTLQFLVAVLVYREPFGADQLVAFGFIWAGVFFYLAFQMMKLRLVPLKMQEPLAKTEN